MTAARPPLSTDDAGQVRCFAGLPLPEAWNAALSRVASRLALGLSSKITWTPPGNWHITVRFLGEVEARLLPEVRAALARVEFRALTIRLGSAGAFGSGRAVPVGQVDQVGRAGRVGAPRTLWAGLAEGAAEVSLLAGRVSAALAPLGFADAREGARGFFPHVTLGRVRGAAAGDDWGLVDRELGAETFASARVDSLVLWRSVLGRGGPKYSVLEAYPAAPGRTAAGA